MTTTKVRCMGGRIGPDFDGSLIDIPCGDDAIAEVLVDDAYSKAMRENPEFDPDALAGPRYDDSGEIVGSITFGEMFSVAPILVCGRCLMEMLRETDHGSPIPHSAVDGFHLIVVKTRMLATAPVFDPAKVVLQPPARREMDGVPVEVCPTPIRFGLTAAESRHGPHLSSDGSVWCPGWSTFDWVCDQAPAVNDALDGRFVGHGGHAWLQALGQWVWCRGWRHPAGLQVVTYGPYDTDDDPSGQMGDFAAGMVYTPDQQVQFRAFDL